MRSLKQKHPFGRKGKPPSRSPKKGGKLWANRMQLFFALKESPLPPDTFLSGQAIPPRGKA